MNKKSYLFAVVLGVGLMMTASSGQAAILFT